MLGVTYSTLYPTLDNRVLQNYHKPRQTITVGLQRDQMKFDNMRMIAKPRPIFI